MNNKLLVLLSTLEGDIEEIISRSNFQADAIIINQCNREGFYTIKNGSYNVFVYETLERGLSKSRNLALKHAKLLPHPYVIFADDDLVYRDYYSEVVTNLHNTNPHADVITFKFNCDGKEKDNLAAKNKIKQVINPYKFYSSVSISVKKNFIIESDLVFDENFGAGSNKVSHGEDSVFIKDCRNNKAKIYESDYCILDVDYSESSWRDISDEKLMFDKGVLWRKLSNYLSPFFGIILIIKLRETLTINPIRAYKFYLKGILSPKRKNNIEHTDR